jgi:hypothetical protein
MAGGQARPEGAIPVQGGTDPSEDGATAQRQLKLLHWWFRGSLEAGLSAAGRFGH